MPQMAPLLWTLLFLLFSTLLIFSASKLHYSINGIKQEKKNYDHSSLTYCNNLLAWKW